MRMKWLDSMQLAAHKRYLNQQLQKPIVRQPKNLRHAQTIGILVDLDGEVEALQGVVQGFARQMQSLQKDVHILGYSDTPKPMEGLTMESFCQKDLNWALIPSKHAAARKFMEMPFDVLIGIQLRPSVAIEYILATSPAHLRVGYFMEETSEFYDLMIDSPDKQVNKYFEKVQNYLNIINLRVRIG